MTVTGKSPQELLLAHLDFIREKVQQLCRRHRAPRDAAEDIFGELKVKLLENDYEVMRRFRGEAQLTTYLTVVIDRFFFDWAAKEWGANRRARTGLAVSVATEEAQRLIERDGFTREEAVRMAAEQCTLGGRVSRRDLDSTVAPRAERQQAPRLVGLDIALSTAASEALSPEESLSAADSQRQLGEVLDQALVTLPAQDRLLVKLRFGQGLTVAAIARTLGLRQRDLYPRIGRALSRLREDLERRGQTWRALRDHVARIERVEPAPDGPLASGAGPAADPSDRLRTADRTELTESQTDRLRAGRRRPGIGW